MSVRGGSVGSADAVDDKPMFASGPAGALFLAILAMWLLLPLLWFGSLAQDGLSPYVASRVLSSDPGQVYIDETGGLFEVQPAFRAEGCDAFPEGRSCEDFLVAFVSPPIALPLLAPLGRLPADLAMFVLRLIAAALLVSGMVVLWRRLAGASSQAPLLLAATAVLLTPLATAPIDHGQTSPLLFASAIVGLGAVGDRSAGAVGRALLWVLTIAFKLFPAALGLLLIFQRRWRMLGIAAGAGAVLFVAAGLLGPWSLWEDFLRASSTIAAQTTQNPYNGSIEAVAFRVSGVDFTTFSPVVLLVRAALVAGVIGLLYRLNSDDERWAVALLGLVALMPQTWWHYSWVAVAAIAVVLWHREDVDRWIWALPVFALVSLPLNIANTRGWSVPVAQLGIQLSVLAFLAVLTTRPERARVRV